MEDLKHLKSLWACGTQLGQETAVIKEELLKDLVSMHLQQERQLLLSYVIKTSVWIFLVTAVFGHLVVRFWGEWPIVCLSLAGLLIYIPFTAMFMRRFKSFYGLQGTQIAQDLSVYEALQQKKADILRFYQFKKLFDFLMIPVCCMLIMLLINRYSFAAPLSVHLTFNLIVLLLALGSFSWATVLDNRRYFKHPLMKIEEVLRDMES